jgi:CRISPR-associated protein Cmr5
MLKSQRMAQAAFNRVQARHPVSEEYRSFARDFPTLVHQCGLAQAVAFALAKGRTREALKAYACDLADVLKVAGHLNAATAEDLSGQTRSLPVLAYVRLSRDALDAAVWLKRYVEALFEDATPQPEKVNP